MAKIQSNDRFGFILVDNAKCSVRRAVVLDNYFGEGVCLPYNGIKLFAQESRAIVCA